MKRSTHQDLSEPFRRMWALGNADGRGGSRSMKTELGSGAERSTRRSDGAVIAPLDLHANGSPSNFPDLRDLASRLRFCPQEGRIWLDDQRMCLMHVTALAALRRELIESQGVDFARGLLSRMGYTSGSADAALARRVRPNETLANTFAVGPQLHALEGIVSVEPIRMEIDVAKGHYYGEFIWRDSVEVDCHLLSYGPSSAPVCWMQIGYACGYTTDFVGRQILFREFECRGTGAPACRIVGRPVEEWGDAHDDLRFFRSEPLIGRSTELGSWGSDRGRQSRLIAAADLAPDAKGEGPDELVGASSSFNAACHNVRKVAPTDATVLFLGETGVGKEIFAQTLHHASRRAAGPFVAVNCAAIPDDLFEAELFGVEKGAFTGALTSRPGRFERADGGTLFLDEVGSLPFTVQGKLLRVLQSNEIERVGDVRARRVDVRVVAATNEDLEAKAAEKSFRPDLYYRLNVFPISLPPLRERRDDIPLLVRHFLMRFTRRYDKRVPGFTERAIGALLDYDYPGNIRELQHIIERAVILATDDVPLDVYLLFRSPPSKGSYAVSGDGHLEQATPGESRRLSKLDRLVRGIIEEGLHLGELQRSILRRALELAGGNVTRAARSIGLTRPQFVYRLKKEGSVDGADEDPSP
jgi:two-component system, NtrC family, response regulator HydG